MEYEVVIGLEIHAELLTRSKVFCSCKNEFGGTPNTNCCPVCIGLPGTLPKLNREVVNFAIKAGLALNCEINLDSKMDRKMFRKTARFGKDYIFFVWFLKFAINFSCIIWN